MGPDSPDYRTYADAAEHFSGPRPSCLPSRRFGIQRNHPLDAVFPAYCGLLPEICKNHGSWNPRLHYVALYLRLWHLVDHIPVGLLVPWHPIGATVYLRVFPIAPSGIIRRYFLPIVKSNLPAISGMVPQEHNAARILRRWENIHQFGMNRMVKAGARGDSRSIRSCRRRL